MFSRLIQIASLAILLIAVPWIRAQTDGKTKDEKLIIAVTLVPNDYPRPALQLHLIPDATESIPGNRVQMFLRCFMEQNTFIFGESERKKREKWSQTSIADLPLKETTQQGDQKQEVDLTKYGGRLIHQDMYDAARMNHIDWQLWYIMRRDGYKTLLPDLQGMRVLAEVIRTRARFEIAARNFDGAIHTLKTLLGLTKTMEPHPTLIGHLVGAATGKLACDALDEMIQQPGCPNLYWVLTDLPVPFLSLRPALEGERLFVGSDFESLRTANNFVNDKTILEKVGTYKELFKQHHLEGVGPPADDPETILQSMADDKERVKAARSRLRAAGLGARVELWHPLHVVLIDEIVRFEDLRDDTCKWMNLPYWEAKPGLDEADLRLGTEIGKEDSLLLRFLPAIGRVKNAQARLDQRIAYLRIMEAIRLHAFKHGGALPKSLDAIKLPLPVDPFTGKAFEYSVKDGVATLHGYNEYPGNASTNRYYEIRVGKK